MVEQSNEDFLNMLVNFALEKRIGVAWRDEWNPLVELRKHGFRMLAGANVVDVRVAQPDEQGVGNLALVYRMADARLPEDLAGAPRRQELEPIVSVQNGMVKLYELRETIRAKFSTCGNEHWGTVTDVAALTDSFDIGIIVFSNREMGLGRWMYSTVPKKRVYPYWIMLYCIDNVHFVLAEFYDAARREYTCFFPNDRLPDPLREHWLFCNPAPQLGGGGMS